VTTFSLRGPLALREYRKDYTLELKDVHIVDESRGVATQTRDLAVHSRVRRRVFNVNSLTRLCGVRVEATWRLLS
jgi:hypothetical protein